MDSHWTAIEPWKLGYLAGMIDAECHVGIQRQLPTMNNGSSRTNKYRSPQYAIRFALAMTDKVSVDFVNSILPSSKVVATRAKGRRLPVYLLRVVRQECLSMLRAVLPFVQGKRRQIELCLELDALRQKYTPERAHFGKAHFQPLPDEFNDKAAEIFAEFRKRQLNKKPRQKRLL